ncbi:DUF302 domain-containing protein [Methylomonas sp. AM2-LC]|uniref:DUF302 domain-containing protein n=1 Tax=Methylomonas sp. AM2-LC TaxID=3153301 RepID=UPI00326459EB
MLKRVFIVLSLLFISGCSLWPLSGERVPFYQVETPKPYDDVLIDLDVAIAEHNFRITAHSRVGKVIRERGAENFPEFDTIQFCNLTLAKTMLEISPPAIGFMPCNIVTYQLDGKTIIKTHLLPEDNDNQALNEFAQQMNPQLRQIVDFAAKP